MCILTVECCWGSRFPPSIPPLSPGRRRVGVKGEDVKRRARHTLLPPRGSARCMILNQWMRPVSVKWWFIFFNSLQSTSFLERRHWSRKPKLKLLWSWRSRGSPRWSPCNYVRSMCITLALKKKNTIKLHRNYDSTTLYCPLRSICPRLVVLAPKSWLWFSPLLQIPEEGKCDLIGRWNKTQQM